MGDRVQEAKEEGIRQGIWLCIQKLVELERFDMAFAAFIVDNMRKQNMLKDEKIAELLKDNPDER